MNNPNKYFASMQEAFSYSREADKPIMAEVDGTLYRVFPSGKALKIRELPPQMGVGQWSEQKEHE